MEEFNPRCASRMGTAISQSQDEASSSGTISIVIERSQTTLSRDLCPLLLKLGGLESDCPGILGGGLILLASWLAAFLRLVGGIGLGSSLGVDWLQERGNLCLAGLAGMVLSDDLAVLADGWGLNWCPTLRTEHVGGSVGAAGLHLSRMACYWMVRASLLRGYRQISS